MLQKIEHATTELWLKRHFLHWEEGEVTGSKPNEFVLFLNEKEIKKKKKGVPIWPQMDGNHVFSLELDVNL